MLAGLKAEKRQNDLVLIDTESADASCPQVRLAYPHVFCAAVVLESPGQPQPLRVLVESFDRASVLDPWAVPSGTVFKRISSVAMCALHYFCWHASMKAQTAAAASITPAASHQGPAGHSHNGATAGTGKAPQDMPIEAGESALENLLLWLLTYQNLFTQPCAISGQLLALEAAHHNPVPPLFRNFRCAFILLL